MIYRQILDIDSIRNFIELFAIVVGTLFGILGTATETRDKTGKLTRWGKIAIIGIILTSLFSFIDNSLKQQSENIQNLNAEKIEKNKLEKENQFQDSVLTKSNISLNSQVKIQQKTDTLLKSLYSSIRIQDNIMASNIAININVDSNLKSQKKIFNLQQTFSEQQQILLTNLTRQLYPLQNPSISFKISIDCYSEIYNNFAKEIIDTCLKIIKKDKDYKSKNRFYGNLLTGDYSIKNDSIIINEIRIEQKLIPNNKFYDIELNEFGLGIEISKNDIRNSNSWKDADVFYSVNAWNEKNGYTPLDLNKSFSLSGSEDLIIYTIRPYEKRIYFFVRTSKVKKDEDVTGKIESLLDLPNSYVKISFYGDTKKGETMDIDWFEIDFGENHSQKVRFTSYNIEKLKPNSMSFIYKIDEKDIFK